MDGHLPHFSLQFIFYNQEWLILETIYVVNKEILQKKIRGFISRAGYNGACSIYSDITKYIVYISYSLQCMCMTAYFGNMKFVSSCPKMLQCNVRNLMSFLIDIVATDLYTYLVQILYAVVWKFVGKNSHPM